MAHPGNDRFAIEPITFTLLAGGLLFALQTHVEFNKNADGTSVDHVADLDDDAQEFIATEIMRLTKPWLFKTAAELEADRKNG